MARPPTVDDSPRDRRVSLWGLMALCYLDLRMNHTLEESVKRVWIAIAMAVGVLLVARPAAAQGHTVVFEGTVITDDAQPAGDRLVVVFFNSREVGRGETTCDASGCHFAISVSDETGIGDMGQDGLAHVTVGRLVVGQPTSFVAPGGAPPRRPIYSIMALKNDPHALPAPFEAGRLGLLPDGSVAVVEEQRPSQPTPPASAPAASAISVGFPWLAVGLLAAACCGSILAFVVVVGLILFALRRPRTTG